MDYKSVKFKREYGPLTALSRKYGHFQEAYYLWNVKKTYLICNLSIFWQKNLGDIMLNNNIEYYS